MSPDRLELFRSDGWIPLVVLIGTGLLSACASLPADRRWGGDATAIPGWQRFAAAAGNAAADPWVWAPLLGAAAFQVDHGDRRASDWMREHTPVFGSERRAERWSDTLRDVSGYAHYATMLATSSGEGGEGWANRARGAYVDVAAVATTVAVTRTLKTTADRERPNGHDDQSFPSGHTSSATVHATLASRNFEFIPVHPALRTAADVGLHALALGTSWARIEAGWHYPSDTLFSLAMGRFIGAVFNDAFLDPHRELPGWTVAVYPLLGGCRSRGPEVC